MAITYPIAFPADVGSVSAELYIMRNQVGTESDNGIIQVTEKLGDRWVGKVTLATMTANQAADYLGFFDALKGMSGSFTFGHPDFTEMRGTANGVTGAINGGSQTGYAHVTDGWGAGRTFLRGDIVQIGATGAGCRLKRVLENATANGSGQVTLQLGPPTLTAHADNTAIYTQNCKGYFRLSQPDLPVPSDFNRRHSFSFAIEEILP